MDEEKLPPLFKETIESRGKAILDALDFPFPRKPEVLEVIMLIRKIVDDENHPWMVEHARRMAQIEKENAPEDEKRRLYEVELLRPFYWVAREMVEMMGKGALDAQHLKNSLNSEQFQLIRDIVHDEDHKWMIDHARAVREGTYVWRDPIFIFED